MARQDKSVPHSRGSRLEPAFNHFYSNTLRRFSQTAKIPKVARETSGNHAIGSGRVPLGYRVTFLLWSSSSASARWCVLGQLGQRTRKFLQVLTHASSQ